MLKLMIRIFANYKLKPQRKIASDLHNIVELLKVLGKDKGWTPAISDQSDGPTSQTFIHQ